LDAGVCRLIPKSEVFHRNGRPLLSGLFVAREEMWGQLEVYRLIMNLVALNKLCQNLGGDISTLPSWASMSSYLLDDNGEG
jgi:hypothetical protein